MPKVPLIFSVKTDEDIQAWANTPDDEVIALEKLGLKPYQVERVRKMDRFKNNWRIGKARWRSRMNLTLEESTDPSVKKVIAEHSMPKIEEIEEGYQWIIDAPGWFLGGLSKAAKA